MLQVAPLAGNIAPKTRPQGKTHSIDSTAKCIAVKYNAQQKVGGEQYEQSEEETRNKTAWGGDRRRLRHGRWSTDRTHVSDLVALWLISEYCRCGVLYENTCTTRV